MQYFFILGNNPTLSAAEIYSVFSRTGDLAASNALVLENLEKIDADNLISRLGGTIKIGEIKKEVPESFSTIFDNILPLFVEKNISGKFNFGISTYGFKINDQKLGLELKKYLKNKSISSRWVTSREPTLSSVVVEQNNLISKGLEIILIKQKNKILIGQTLAVQPFKELSFRDYGRPGRDDMSGMLPPKLAQIMINLSEAKADNIILDPFCGSGTILTEAALMGYKNLTGSDISAKAVSDTQVNIDWVKSKFQLATFNLQLFHLDSRELSRQLEPNSIDAIITEPYLGPQRGKIKIDEVIKELNNLYSQSLAEFAKVLKPDGRIVMIWPVFRLTHNTQRLMPDITKFKIISPLPENLQQDKKIKLTDRHTIIYGRENQKVWREIVVMKKNN